MDINKVKGSDLNPSQPSKGAQPQGPQLVTAKVIDSYRVSMTPTEMSRSLLMDLYNQSPSDFARQNKSQQPLPLAKLTLEIEGERINANSRYDFPKGQTIKLEVTNRGLRILSPPESRAISLEKLTQKPENPISPNATYQTSINASQSISNQTSMQFDATTIKDKVLQNTINRLIGMWLPRAKPFVETLQQLANENRPTPSQLLAIANDIRPIGKATQVINPDQLSQLITKLGKGQTLRYSQTGIGSLFTQNSQGNRNSSINIYQTMQANSSVNRGATENIRPSISANNVSAPEQTSNPSLQQWVSLLKNTLSKYLTVNNKSLTNSQYLRPFIEQSGSSIEHIKSNLLALKQAGTNNTPQGFFDITYSANSRTPNNLPSEINQKRFDALSQLVNYIQKSAQQSMNDSSIQKPLPSLTEWLTKSNPQVASDPQLSPNKLLDKLKGTIEQLTQKTNSDSQQSIDSKLIAPLVVPKQWIGKDLWSVFNLLKMHTLTETLKAVVDSPSISKPVKSDLFTLYQWLGKSIQANSAISGGKQSPIELAQTSALFQRILTIIDQLPSNRDYDIGRQWLRLLQGQSARIQMDQLSTMTQRNQTDSNNNQLVLQTSLPLWTGSTPSSAQLQIYREFESIQEDADQESDNENRSRWSFTLYFDIEPLGPLYTHVHLHMVDQLPDAADVELWSDGPPTLALINQHQQSLVSSLAKHGFKIEALTIRKGMPAKTKVAISHHLVDVRT